MIHVWLALVAILFALPPAHLALSWCALDVVAVFTVEGAGHRAFIAGDADVVFGLVPSQAARVAWRPPRFGQVQRNPGVPQ